MEVAQKKIKPILKWVGGKTQIMDKLMEKVPTTIHNYYEIFLGGGSVLLALLSNPNITITGDIYACDLNEALIFTYKNIQNNHEALALAVEKMKEEYQKCPLKGEVNRKPIQKEDALESRESYYFWIRKEYNATNDKRSVEASAMFIFLNKRGFRGMFRESSNGFNVPYGNYKTVNILDFEHLKEVSELIRNVKFIHGDFETTLKGVQKRDFVYLDPPYAPENSTSFVGYNKDGFGLEKHKTLFNMVKKLKCKWLFSNANVKLIQNSFPEDEYTVEKITARRSINSKKPGSKTVEVLISNKLDD
jgi:DNA adenine methylase